MRLPNKMLRPLRLTPIQQSETATATIGNFRNFAGMIQEHASTSYETTLFHNMRPIVIMAPVTIGLTALLMWMMFETGVFALGLGAVLVPILILVVLRKPIWSLFSEPATVSLDDASFTITLSGSSTCYSFNRLLAYKTYRGSWLTQITVYTANEKSRTFSFLETSAGADINPVLGIEEKIKEYNAAAPQNRIAPGVSFLASRSGAVLLIILGVVMATVIVANIFYAPTLLVAAIPISFSVLLLLAKRNMDLKKLRELSATGSR